MLVPIPVEIPMRAAGIKGGLNNGSKTPRFVTSAKSGSPCLLRDEVNHICGHDVISGRIGGDKGGGAQLTPFGLALVERYRNIEQAVQDAVRNELLALQ